MAIYEIEYQDKDKNGVNPVNQWRDVDANEVKDIVNQKADLVDGVVPEEELPSSAITVENATDVDNTNKEDGYILAWSEDEQMFVFVPDGAGITSIEWDVDGDIFDSSVTEDGTGVILGLGFQDQAEGEVLIGPVSGDGQPSFRRLEKSDLPGAGYDDPVEITGDFTIEEPGAYSYTGEGGHTITFANEVQFIELFNNSSNGSDVGITSTNIFGAGTTFSGVATYGNPAVTFRWASFLNKFIW